MKHDRLKDIGNPVVRLHFFQNKQWLIRCQCYESKVLYVKSKQAGKLIEQIKADLRLSVFNSVQLTVGNVLKIFDCKVEKSAWFSNPALLKEELQPILGEAHPEFRIQLGSQFSTAAHVMMDIYYDSLDQFSIGGCQKSLYPRTAQEYKSLTAEFYHVRDFIDPYHQFK